MTQQTTNPSSTLAHNRTTGAFERRVAAQLELSVSPSDAVVVACSGGPDSTAALVAIARSRVSGGGPVFGAHFDHGIRSSAEASGDLTAVSALASALGIRFVNGAARTSEAGTPRSEEYARAARYRWLAGVCADLDVGACVTAHTLDDQAETVLLRLVRGSGLPGVAGMALEVPWPFEAQEDLRVVRPLLAEPRAAVEEYLDALRLEPRLDPSNRDTDIARNRIRLNVLPELKHINPRAREALARFADLARRDDEALNLWAHEAYRELASPAEGDAQSTAVSLQRRALRELPPAVGSRVLRIALEQVGMSAGAAEIDALLRLCGRRSARLSLSGGAAAVTDSTIEVQRRF